MPSQPLLVIVSPFYPSPPYHPFLPRQFSLLISPSLFLYPPTPALLAPHHLHPQTHHHHPPTSLSLSKDLQATVPSLQPPPPPPQPPACLLPPPPPPITTTTSSTPPQPLFLSERMFQPLHTDSLGILCVEMFLLDPQALTIYRTKARAPLLKAWHL